MDEEKNKEENETEEGTSEKDDSRKKKGKIFGDPMVILDE